MSQTFWKVVLCILLLSVCIFWSSCFYFVSPFYFMCHSMCLLNLFLEHIKKKKIQLDVVFSAYEFVRPSWWGDLSVPRLASLSIKRNWTLSCQDMLCGSKHDCLQRIMHDLEYFLLLWSGGKGLKNTGILIFFFFCLNQSSRSYSHRITFTKYLLVIHLWWIL